MHVIYEDNHLLILDKPAGLLTQESGSGESSLEQQARDWIKEREKKEGNVYLHAVHRLDREAQGIVLFAKSSKALKRLQSDLKGLGWKKEYLAVVEGQCSLSGTLTHFLVHGDHRAEVVEEGCGGKLARLQFECLEHKEGFSLLRIVLETGRYHQIRAQLACIGHPIAGDVKYRAKKRKEKGIALLHSRLEFTHPVGGKRVVAESKINVMGEFFLA